LINCKIRIKRNFIEIQKTKRYRTRNDKTSNVAKKKRNQFQ